MSLPSILTVGAMDNTCCVNLSSLSLNARRVYDEIGNVALSTMTDYTSERFFILREEQDFVNLSHNSIVTC